MSANGCFKSQFDSAQVGFLVFLFVFMMSLNSEKEFMSPSSFFFFFFKKGCVCVGGGNWNPPRVSFPRLRQTIHASDHSFSPLPGFLITSTPPGRTAENQGSGADDADVAQFRAVIDRGKTVPIHGTKVRSPSPRKLGNHEVT